jgi:hypothetical protein
MIELTRKIVNVAVLYSAPPIPAGFLQESGHSSGIPVEFQSFLVF